MDITLQYFDGCPNWQVLDHRIAATTAGRADITIRYERVETPEDAVRNAFHGSPTMLIDGVDPFADEYTQIGLACRMFQTPDGPAGSPTVDHLRTVLDRAESAGTTRIRALDGLPLPARSDQSPARIRARGGEPSTTTTSSVSSWREHQSS